MVVKIEREESITTKSTLFRCDHTGLMHCMPSCARTLKKKYSSWQPTLQMVMFDAHSINGGKTWEVKNLCYIDYDQATTVSLHDLMHSFEMISAKSRLKNGIFAPSM